MAIANGADGGLVDDVASVREEVEGTDAPIRPDRLLKEGMILETAAGGANYRAAGPQPFTGGPVARGPTNVDQRRRDHADIQRSRDAEGSGEPIDEWRASIERVRGLDARVALPGHGRQLTDVAALTDDYRTGFTRDLDATAALLNHEPLDAATVMNMRYPDTDEPSLAVWRFLETLNYLTHLATHGRAIRNVDDSGGITWTRS